MKSKIFLYKFYRFRCQGTQLSVKTDIIRKYNNKQDLEDYEQDYKHYLNYKSVDHVLSFKTISAPSEEGLMMGIIVALLHGCLTHWSKVSSYWFRAVCYKTWNNHVRPPRQC